DHSRSEMRGLSQPPGVSGGASGKARARGPRRPSRTFAAATASAATPATATASAAAAGGAPGAPVCSLAAPYVGGRHRFEQRLDVPPVDAGERGQEGEGGDGGKPGDADREGDVEGRVASPVLHASTKPVFQITVYTDHLLRKPRRRETECAVSSDRRRGCRRRRGRDPAERAAAEGRSSPGTGAFAVYEARRRFTVSTSFAMDNEGFHRRTCQGVHLPCMLYRDGGSLPTS